MIQAFVTLADTLNLSRTAEVLATTRQTVRRHIDALEEEKGAPLFRLEGQAYVLTEYGQALVEDARLILNDVHRWAKSGAIVSRGSKYLEHARFTDAEGRLFLSQQHPVSQISRKGSDLVRRTFAAWGKSGGEISSEAFEEVGPSLVTYRGSKAGWVCVAVGQQSAYAKWFGSTWAQSAIGRLAHEDNAGDDVNDFVYAAYERIYSTGSIRFDHMMAHLPRPDSTEPVPVTFHRLLIGCLFPDGAPALIVLVDITKDVEIPGRE